MPQTIQVLTGPSEGLVLEIAEGEAISLGRSRKNDISFVYDPWISGSHAYLKFVDQRLMLEDLQSSNGSFIDGERLLPGNFYPVNQFFVLGTTLFKLVPPLRAYNLDPRPVDDPEVAHLLGHPLLQAALQTSQQAGAKYQVIASINLFKALLANARKDMVDLLKHVEINQLVERLNKLELFQGNERWINSFLSYQQQMPVHEKFLLTPTVQALLNGQLAKGGYTPATFFKSILSHAGHLISPLLAPPPPNDSLQVIPPSLAKPKASRDISLQDNFYPSKVADTLKLASTKGKVVLLLGDAGQGKSAMLHHFFDPNGELELPGYEGLPRKLLDLKQFLIFREVRDLAVYLKQMIKILKGDHIAVIDHFGFLMRTAGRLNLDTAPLIQQISERNAPTFLAARPSLAKPVLDALPNVIRLYMTRFTKDLDPLIFDNMLKQFEGRHQWHLSENAKAYMKKTFTSPCNFHQLEGFLNYCGQRLKGLTSFSTATEDLPTSTNSLSRAFFEVQLMDWSRGRQKEGDADTQANESPTEPPTPSAKGRTEAAPFALEVEILLRRFMEDHLKTPLVYSDQSRGLAEHIALALPDKEVELRKCLEKLLIGLHDAFPKWLNSFRVQLSPDEIINAVHNKENAKALWEEFTYRFELMDEGYELSHFMSMVARLLKGN